MRRILVLVLLSVSTCGYAAAQQNPADAPASKEDVEKYLKLAHSKELMKKTMEAMSKPMRQMAHDQCSKDKMPADCEARLNKSREEMMASMPWDEMTDAMIPVYQKHFTKLDIDRLVAFYSSATGQKLLSEMPEITAEALQNMMPIMRKRLDAMNQRLEEELAAMAKGSDGKKTGPQTND